MIFARHLRVDPRDVHTDLGDVWNLKRKIAISNS